MSTDQQVRLSSPRSIDRQRHLSRVAKRSTLRRERGERGYVLVVTSIVLPVLVLFVALATDVTYLYARSVELQRIADSSALAGVTRMPRQTEASRVALEVAKRNGAQNGRGGITISASAPAESNKRLKVTVRDAKIPLFFGRIFKEYWDVTKSSTAEYVSNIPLGSVLNAIGTGDMAGLDSGGGMLNAVPQNFWLSVAGPCVPKENGDQLSSRYDGNAINANEAPGNTGENRFARLCDYDPDPMADRSDVEDRLAYIAGQRDVANGSPPVTPSMFPAVSINRDFDAKGYNYIVDLPCTPLVAGGAPPPPPCAATDKITSQFNIDVFDPVFNPDSVQQFIQNRVQIKPDSYALSRKSLPIGTDCVSTSPANCQGVTPNGPSPQNVRVTTEFRVYAPDDTPNDYDDDEPVVVPANVPGLLPLTANLNTVTSHPTEANRIQQFGSCVNLTDNWTLVKLDGTLDRDPANNNEPKRSADINKDYLPDALLGGDAVISASNALDTAKDPMCTENASRWRTLMSLPVDSLRGRYRVNVRTVSSPSSLGTNSFAFRASMGATFTSCDSIASPESCPSVAGDSSMSVYAGVDRVVSFYLAKLAPAPVFRNKTIIVQMWDPGEGGSTIEVLEPSAATCKDAAGNDIANAEPGYCVSKFDWTVYNPGVNKSDAANAFNPNGEALGDPCASYGETDKYSLSVQGDWNSFGSPRPATCDVQPPNMVASRQGFAPRKFDWASEGFVGTPTAADVAPCTVSGPSILCASGRFNDRTVAVQIRVPNNYGCVPPSGVGADPCVESATPPEGGWWKIRYTPITKPWKASPPELVKITDRTTWTVQLLGDPVHLVDAD